MIGLAGFVLPGLGLVGACGAFGLWGYQNRRLRGLAYPGFLAPIGVLVLMVT